MQGLMGWCLLGVSADKDGSVFLRHARFRIRSHIIAVQDSRDRVAAHVI